ncbi:hypothetical protein N7470_002043 [Penicillium chermesinum]|nr:hypothetical protein N7470_002043 [Penicillium chermesinum]
MNALYPSCAIVVAQEQRSPPFPSPTDTVSPAAVPPPHLHSPRSPSHRFTPDLEHVGGISLDTIKHGLDMPGTSPARLPRFSRGDSAEQLGLTPVPEDPRPASERQEELGRSSQTLKELRRQMEELLVYQQMQQQAQQQQQQASQPPHYKGRNSRNSHTPFIRLHWILWDHQSCRFSESPPPEQTPSYPFPRTQTQPKPSIEQIGRQGQFRLKLPSERSRSSISQAAGDEPSVDAPAPGSPATFQPGDSKITTEDGFGIPAPNLYDLTLKLNADAGLDGWWSNLIEILQTDYGAERVSLAVPGDATDLENVPWGQKAVFNQEGTALADVSPTSANLMPPPTPGPKFSDEKKGRPEVGVEFRNKSCQKTFSLFTTFLRWPSPKHEKKHARIDENSSLGNERKSQCYPDQNDSEYTQMGYLRHAVFPIARPLEVETDPLIKRTGVVRLFGRTTPVILTREYVKEAEKHPGFGESPLDVPQGTPVADTPSAPVLRTEGDSGKPKTNEPKANVPFNARRLLPRDEYEQIPHDSYPIAAWWSLQPKLFLPLRFPVAVISLLSNIVPYPAELRQSLSHLMPHLTTSFCLAQQYSQLERQLNSKVETPRYGHLLGLGGTFSDASSELELVAGLSGHVSYSVGDDNPMSARASVQSPSDRSSMKISPSVSVLGTPALDPGQPALATTSQSPGIFGSTSEFPDGYFNLRQTRATKDSNVQPRHRSLKSKGKLALSMPASPGKLPEKPVTEDSTAQEPTSTAASPVQEMKPPVISPSQHSSSRQSSTTSFYAQLQRDLPRPFSDSIAQLMLNSIPLHIFLAKPKSGEVIWTNAKFDAYRRSKPQEHKLRDPWQNIHISERDHVSSEWANALRTGSQFTERVRVRRFNDESAYRWFIFRANPLLSSTGEVLYWIGSFLDIHEQHTTELKATQEREKFATDAKYRAFSNSIPQVVFEATEKRGLIFVNEQWNLYTGQKLQDALDLGFAKHVHPDDLQKCGGLTLQVSGPKEDNWADAASTSEGGSSRSSSEIHGVSSALDELVRRGVASLQRDENGRVFYSTELRLRSRGGDFRWHLVRLVRVETSSFGSEEASWYGTCTDINDRKNLESQLNKAMTQLNNQMESKTKFFSNMSHEIRTPLNGILGTIPFILDTQLDSDQRRMLDTIQNSSTNLRELVDNILDVSRVEAGKMSLVNSWFHVRSMIEDVIDTVASRAIDKGLEINYLMDADVPSMVIGDRFRVRQVLINLVGNAVKFTTQGEIHIYCNLSRNSPGKVHKPTEIFLNFDVVDTGKGFSAQDAERLMQRFSQLGENGSQQNAGSGLGLFLSKQLVEMHGGSLTPSATEGKGAQFSFNVRVDAPPPPSASERPHLLRQASGASRRPSSSRTTSYDQYTVAPRSIDLRLQDTVSLSSGLLSNLSSPLATPDPGSANVSPRLDQEIPGPAGEEQKEKKEDMSSTAQPSVQVTPPPLQSERPLSIFILCPLENTRKSTQQHIEQVVPHEIPFKITALSDVDEWKDMIHTSSNVQCTHLVLNLPATDDILEVIQNVSETPSDTSPVVVIISDLYQKRQISTRVKELAATGKKVFIVPKPVKPSAFSTIFDPESKRELSKDRNQDMAREINNNFKTVSKMVKEVLGNKGYRILLVEDDETNRDVMLKYLDKIKLMSETASNGQECVDMVLSKEPGYYSLIICDIQMPIKNGYDTCREIRAWEQKNHYPQIPIMALSANAMTDQIENAADAGFNDYVTKPIKHNELGKMMMGLLDTSRPLLLLRDRLHPQFPEPPTHRR